MDSLVLLGIVVLFFTLVWLLNRFAWLLNRYKQIHKGQPLLNDNAEDDIQRPNNDALNKPLTNEVATMQSANTITTSDTSANEKPSSLRWLPVAFYIIASLGFLGWIIIALNLGSWVAFGYGVGSTIACFAGGRTIELLQNIDDELYRKRMSR